MSEIPANFTISQPSLSKQSALMNIHGWSDFLGLAASIGCAIHCAALPFLLTFLPSLNLNWMAHTAFHQYMFGACFLIAVVAFVPGLLRHGSSKPIALGSLGLTLIGVAAFAPSGCGCGGCTTCAAIRTSSESSILAPMELNGTGHRGFHRQPEWMMIQASYASSPVEPQPQMEAISTQPIAPDESGENWWAGIVPWLTPLGGILLIGAHLLNHHLDHFGRFCRC
jgi:hypothetical protein